MSQELSQCTAQSLLHHPEPLCKVFSVKDPTLKLSFFAKVQILSEQQVKDIQQGNFSWMFQEKHRIVKLSFTTIQDKICLMTITDPKSQPSVCRKLSQISISSEDTLKLMLQTMLLKNNLHSVGIALNGSLEQFMQCNISAEKEEINLVTFDNKMNSRNHPGQLFGEEELSDMPEYIKQEELMPILEFLRSLLLRNKQYSVSEKTKNKKLEAIEKRLQKNYVRQQDGLVSLQDLQTQLQTYYVQKPEGSFMCQFNFLKGQLFAKFTDRRDKENEITKPYKYRNIQTNLLQRSSLKLFCLLASKQQNDIQIEFPNKVRILQGKEQKGQLFEFQDQLKGEEQQGKILENIEQNTSGVFTKQELENGGVKPKGGLRTNMGAFPNFCLVQIYAKFDLKQNEWQKSVGSLVEPRLVLTCAHAIYRNGMKPLTVFVLVGKQKVEVEDWKVCTQDTDGEKHNDFGLVLLKEPIVRSKYLDIAYDFSTKARVRLMKFQQNQQTKTIKVNFVKNKQELFAIKPVKNKQELLAIKPDELLNHQMNTRKGDSGSPLLVDLHHLRSSYIVAIHTRHSQLDNINRAVRITKEKFDTLVKYQKELMKDNPLYRPQYNQFDREPSFIKRAISFQKLKYQTKKSIEHFSNLVSARPTENSEKATLTGVYEFIDNIFNNPSIEHCYSQKDENGQKIKKKKMMSLKDIFLKQFELDQKGMNFVNKYRNYSVPFPADFEEANIKERNKLLNQMKQFYQQHKKIVNWFHLNPYKDMYARHISYLQTGKCAFKPWPEIFAEFRQKVENVFLKNIHKMINFMWERQPLKYKFDHAKKHPDDNLYPLSTHYLFTYSKVFEKQAIYLHLINQKFGKVMNKDQLMRWNVQISHQKAQTEAYIKYHQIESFTPPLPDPRSPFSFYRKACMLTKEYNQQYGSIYQMEVEFYSSDHLDQYCLQQLQWTYKDFLFVVPERKIYKIQDNRETKQKFELNIKIHTFMERKLTEIPYICNNYSKIPFINFLKSAASFISQLHKKDFNLCSPLEFCTFIYIEQNQNISTWKQWQWCWYYFGYWKGLIYKFKSMDNEKREELSQYYPVDEILANEHNKQAFKAIDIWMFGKSLLRLIQELLIRYPNREELEYLREFAGSMIEEKPEDRPSIQDAILCLESYFEE